MKQSPKIVIVGGGAGGLELATRLGRALGYQDKAKIILVDENPTHLWKPLLHEVAAGTLDATHDELNYFIHASNQGYFFQLGKMVGVDRQKKQIKLAPIFNDQDQEIIPERAIDYDVLVLAFGSITNDLNVPGVKEHCLFLDNRKEADYFQQIFLKNLLKLQLETKQKKLNIAIVGGGATGVELAAELQQTVRQAKAYGLDHINPEKDIQIVLIEAAPRILPNLPERISALALQELKKRHVEVLVNECVKEVRADALITTSDKIIEATMIVWAVGVKTQSFADKLDGLALNNRNQILVTPTLQTTVDVNIFAFGDCAACPIPNSNQFVPPRAQAATQEAALLAKSLPRYLKGQTLLPFQYKDYGSLVSLSHSQTLGSLMGKLLGSVLIAGKIARWIYLSLYKKHQSIIHGYSWVWLHTMADWLTRKSKPRLKMH